MKKLLLITALAAVASLSAYGQGSVNFANSTATRVILQNADGTTTFAPTGSRFAIELVAAPDGTPTDAFQFAATRVGQTATFFPVAGQFSAGGRTALNVTPAGGFGLFQVRVWETANGVDYNDSVLRGVGFAGQSGILRVDTGDPTTTPPGPAGSLLTGGLASFTVSAVPEPSTIALGLLGIGTLLMLRRRK